ncbi:hypothetical protein GF406_16200 [candidate division KSB1 bacterium]|nr:hypothetical protein [candidate division KSB1 bacterium]
MKNFKIDNAACWLSMFFWLLPMMVFSQARDYRIHDRGMLHQTIFNTGTIGRPWQYGQAGESTDLPLSEYPPYSRTIVEGIEYSGQHNMIGAGVHVSANVKGRPGLENRIIATCGGVGTQLPELPLGRWSFPISIEEIENFPLIPDQNGHGRLNPDYNPDEAEEIIISKWSTPTGIQVTRTSRVWSYPDFDDMIIYEYEFEHTGDIDGYTNTIERDTTLHDVLFGFQYGFAQSMFGIQRSYGSWEFDAYSRGDSRNFYDPDYWLCFDMVMQTTAADVNFEKAAHPEPVKDLFREWAETGKNGGGLLSPQAPGLCFIKWDTEHLAVVDPDDPERNESEKINYLNQDDQGNYWELDENGHVKQPWNWRCPTNNARASKMFVRANNINERWGGVFTPDFVELFGTPDDYGYPAPAGEEYLGRGRCSHTEAWNGGAFNVEFGPYTMELGDKIHLVMAEVIGYGASEGKLLVGGTSGDPFMRAPSWNREIVLDGEVMTEHYLDDYGYPDYVNSNVVTVNQVAHKAFEAYLGETIEYDSTRQGPAQGVMWPEHLPGPEENPNMYKIPAALPAPVIVVENTPTATVQISWNQAAETFTHPRLSSTLTKYNLYRGEAGHGPWTLLKSFDVGDVNSDGLYLYEDLDQTFRLGESKYYCVTSEGDDGLESGKTNIILHDKNVAAKEELDNVYVVPNPFIGQSGFEGVGKEDAIGFYGLPEKCTIRIFSYAGQLVETIEHDKDVFSRAWFQISRNRQDIASGIYTFVVTTPDDKQATGKFVIIK